MKLTPELPTFGKTILILKTMPYNSSFTSQQVEQRLLQGYYDDIVKAGKQGGVIGDEENVTKEQLDLSLAKTLKGQGGITKEQVEEVLTGTIKSHNHDTEYEEYGTDVWDGTSVSTSLEGSGTKEDPYLIQSCADWVHVYTKADQYAVYTQGNYNTATEFKPVFKLMKNLDFGSKDIDVSSVESKNIFMCEFDGNHAKVSNFKTPLKGSHQYGIFSPMLVFTFIHDFIFDNVQIEINESNQTGLTLWGIPSGDTVNAMPLNNIIDLKVAFRGNITPDTERLTIPIVCESGYIYSGIPNIQMMIDNYLQENGHFVGCNVVGVNGVTGTWELKADFIFCSAYVGFTQAQVIYCSNSLSELEPPITGQPTFVGDKMINVAYMIMGAEPAKVYTNSDGSNTIVVQGSDEEITVFTGTPKSLEEMKSSAFVAELNFQLPKPAFMKDPKGGTPVLAQYGGIKYDGYVKQSEFESFKKNMPSTVNPNDFIYELRPEVYAFTTDSTSEEISAAVGGESGVKEIIQAVKNGNRLVIRGTLDDFAGMTINQDVQCSMYAEGSNGDMQIVLFGKGYLLWGGTGGVLGINYTKSSNTFSCGLTTA